MSAAFAYGQKVDISYCGDDKTGFPTYVDCDTAITSKNLSLNVYSITEIIDVLS